MALHQHDRPNGHEFQTAGILNQPLQILVAEDNPTNQKLVQRMLDRLGYQAHIVGNGLEVLAALARQRYDVVLMDIEMPEMNGLEATQRIRQRWPGAQGPRIVAVTADVSAQEQTACTAAGVDGFIGKPIQLGDLAAALQSCRPEAAPPQPRIELKPGPATPLGGDRPEAPQAILDPKALAAMKAMVGGQGALMVALIDSALQDAPQLLLQMRQALEKDNAVELRRAAHTLKSLASGFGAVTLARLNKEMEALGKAGTFQGVPERLAQAETEYEQVKTALEAARTTYQE